MDLLLSYTVTFFSIVILLLSSILFKQRTAFKDLRLPPGPWPLPIIGNLHCLIGSLPHRALRDLSQRYGPLLLLQLGETPTVIASSIEASRGILTTHDVKFASRPISPTVHILSAGGKAIGFSSYGEYWRRVRKICVVELLSNKQVQSFRSIREEEANNLVQNIYTAASSGQLINLHEVLTMLTNDITVKTVIGDKCKDPDLFVKELDNIVKLASGFSLVDLYPSSWLLRLISRKLEEAKRCRERVYQFLDGIIAQQRERKSTKGDGVGKDFLSVLLRIHDENTEQIPLDIDNIKTIIGDIFTAGSETTSTTLLWAMSELIRNHRVMQKAQSEVRELLRGCTTINESDLVRLNYLHLVIKETLRLHPPVPLLLPRQCRETCRILEYDIPKGATVLVNVWAIGRDPKYWEDPEEFKPERFATSNVDFRGTDFQFLPFGSGRRMCPGTSFGLASLELALATLLYHFDWKLPANVKPEDVDMSEAHGITLRKKTPLILHAVPHKSDMA
ncbi:cytochrome P450 family 71 polypeptide [Rhynchospora pubera]|uniref:Cytochrome P450 family 71 polypeptide n=1 Tax=Rhynchospora pubera TaxID=906938 RepID=A0AAV8FQD5_9POAL|nr:cytochrome P450 family 71 polypeptide [Rhynchospora pubera]KAJ4793944.1 cytochrome P450 family 71 polypeptide [Rhynchospora pubera]